MKKSPQLICSDGLRKQVSKNSQGNTILSLSLFLTAFEKLYRVRWALYAYRCINYVAHLLHSLSVTVWRKTMIRPKKLLLFLFLISACGTSKIPTGGSPNLQSLSCSAATTQIETFMARNQTCNSDSDCRTEYGNP